MVEIVSRPDIHGAAEARAYAQQLWAIVAALGLMCLAVPVAILGVLGAALSAGRLAYVGSDGNIYVLSADSDGPLAVTDDATPSVGGRGRCGSWQVLPGHGSASRRASTEGSIQRLPGKM